MQHLQERGVWVTVSRPGSDPVSGWLIGEIPQGLLLAVDEKSQDVRLIAEYDSISYNHDKVLPRLRYDNAREIEEKLAEASSAVSAPVRSAISKIKFDRLHQFGHRSSELEGEIHRWQFRGRGLKYEGSLRAELIGYLAAQADQTTALHRGVYETFEDSGLADVLDEFGPMLASLPFEFIIPAYDLEFESRDNLTSALEATREKRWTTKRHRASLAAAEAIRTRLMFETGSNSERKSEGKSKQPDDSTFFSRWVGPSLRILAGTGLATANAAVGVTAGLTGSIATIGATAVPTYVGVVTSIYTGLAQVADGLEKVGRRK